MTIEYLQYLGQCCVDMWPETIVGLLIAIVILYFLFGHEYNAQ